MSSDTQAQSLSQGAQLLEKEILQKIKEMRFPTSGGSQVEIQDGIKQNLDAVAFDKHNQSGIVEARATFKVTREKDSPDKLFELEIIWGMSTLTENPPNSSFSTNQDKIDADNPLPSNQANAQTAHYGYEIYKDGKRVAGPGHVFFKKDVILPHYRISNIELVEDFSLKLTKSGKIGNGWMEFETHYFGVKRHEKNSLQ